MEPVSQATETQDGGVQLELRHTVGAPPERVFRAWTEPAQMRAWFCPEGFTVGEARADPREGGAYRVQMLSPEGSTHTAVGTYRAVEPPRRLIFTWHWEESEGDPEWGAESEVTVELHPAGDGTEVVLTHRFFPTAPVRDEHVKGWTGALRNLAAYLNG